MAIQEQPAYYYSTTDSTSNVSYYNTNRFYEVRWYSNFDSALTTSAQAEVDEHEPLSQNWAELRKYFIGFHAKKLTRQNRAYIIRQPIKCHRNIRRERIQRFMKKL